MPHNNATGSVSIDFCDGVRLDAALRLPNSPVWIEIPGTGPIDAGDRAVSTISGLARSDPLALSHLRC